MDTILSSLIGLGIYLSTDENVTKLLSLKLEHFANCALHRNRTVVFNLKLTIKIP